MTKLVKLWLEETTQLASKDTEIAIRIDWDNDRHQRIKIEDNTPEYLARALKEAGSLVNAERAKGNI